MKRVVDVDAAGGVDRAHERAPVAQVEPPRDLVVGDRPAFLGETRLTTGWAKSDDGSGGHRMG